MSECVVRMEMPNRCMDCPLHEFGGICRLSCDFKQIDVMVIDKGRPENCPILCQLPEGHGRLVDADACASVLKKLENEAVRAAEKLCYGFSAVMFEEANTIVPAEAERSET